MHQLSIQFWRLGCLGFGELGFRLVAAEGSGQTSSASTELNTNIGSPGVRDRKREIERHALEAKGTPFSGPNTAP